MLKTKINRFDDWLHGIILLLADAITIIICFVVGYGVWQQVSQQNAFIVNTNFKHLFFDMIVLLFMLWWGGMYRLQSNILNVVKLKDLVEHLILGYGVVIGVNFFLKTFITGRMQAVVTLSLLLPAFIIERSLIDLLWERVYIKKFRLKRLLIYGAGDTGKRLAKSVRKHPKLGYKPIGFIDDEKPAGFQVTTNPLYVKGSFKDLFNIATNSKVNEVWIAMPKADSSDVIHVMDTCTGLGIPYKFVPSLNQLALHNVDMQALDGVPLFGVRKFRLSLFNCIVKRIFDIILSLSIMITLSPVYLLIALIVRNDSPGPIVFKQKRVGLNGKEFDFYKFRSMYIDAPPYAVNPYSSDDPRITKIGRFLRRTSLDELPQFWNVIKGDMSIVGPRPEMPFIVAEYNEVHRERLAVKPGITCIWQISGDRSLPIHENIDHDLYYIEHQSLLLDVIIIFQTIFFAIRGVGAC